MTTQKPEIVNIKEKNSKNYNSSREHRDFGRHDVYMPKNINNGSNNKNGEEIKFRFKNSLIVTPNYTTEFNGTGGIKYIKNHDDTVFFTGGNIFFRTNNIQKMPVLLTREINKLSGRKKLTVEEKYNYEEKYAVNQSIILYYDENRLDYQTVIKKSDPENSVLYQNGKDVTTEFSLNLTVPGIQDAVAYKKFTGDYEYKNFLSKLSRQPDKPEQPDSETGGEFDRDSPILDGVEYIIIKCGRSSDSYMTVYPGKEQILKYNNKSLWFSVPNNLNNLNNPNNLNNFNNFNQDAICINLRIYLEKYIYI